MNDDKRPTDDELTRQPQGKFIGPTQEEIDAEAAAQKRQDRINRLRQKHKEQKDKEAKEQAAKLKFYLEEVLPSILKPPSK